MKKIFLIILCIILVALAANFVLAKKAKTITPLFSWPWQKACTGSGPVILGTSPVDPKDLAIVTPMGQMVGDHVTPIDHGYFYSKYGYDADVKPVAVRAPAKGVITAVSLMVRRDRGRIYNDYQITIEHTCTFSTRFSNMTSLSKLILDKTGVLVSNQYLNPKMTVREGDIIGYITNNSLDVWVINNDITLKGFLVPEHYKAEQWKLHMVDLFDYMKEPAKSQLLALNSRTASPRWGKIDYDVDGRLVGNWFVEGTNGYAGSVKNPGDEGASKTHLAIVYNAIDPSGIEISLGNYNGQSAQFGVKGNAPDPAMVSVGSGLIKYELVQMAFVDGTGNIWFGRYYASGVKIRNNDNYVQGTVLVQMLDKRKMKMEIFPGQTADQVSGFTSNAIIYER